MAKLHRHGEYVGRGEKKTARELEKSLPDNWDIVANKVIVSGHRSYEVDFIVLGPNSIFVIDEKSWHGLIVCHQNGWILTNDTVPSPIDKIDHRAKVLATSLRSSFPALPKSQRIVQGRVILSNPTVTLQSYDPRSHEQVLCLQDAALKLQGWDGQQPATALATTRALILRQLVGLPNRPKVPKQIADYRVLERVSQFGPVQCLRAQHADGSIKLLKVVEQPSTADTADEEEETAARLREYVALKRLAGLGCAPAVTPYFTWDRGSCWVMAMEPLVGSSLRDDRLRTPPSSARIWACLHDAFECLARIHSEGVIHRAINPDRVHILASGGICFSDFIIARLQGEHTIGAHARELDPETEYTAPECSLGAELAGFTSDVYSLARALDFWITGTEHNESTSVDTLSSLQDAQLASLWAQLLRECTLEDYSARPTATRVLEIIRAQAGVLRPSAVPGWDEPSVNSIANEQTDVESPTPASTRVPERGTEATGYLVYDDPAGVTTTLWIGREVVYVGRQPLGERTLQVPQRRVSRTHLAIQWHELGYAAADLSSTNGTTLNGVQMEPRKDYELSEGDSLVLGCVFELVFRTA